MRAAAVLGSALALVTPAAALAQGGPAGSGSGAGCTGGGGGGGVATSCARITQLADTTGYYSVWAAIWTHFAIVSSCRDASWQLT